MLSNPTARSSSAAFSAARPSAGLRPSRRNVSSQPTELLTAFIANVRARSRAVSASASGVVSGGLSSVVTVPFWFWGESVVVVGPRTSVDEASKSAVAGCERTSGRCCAKNWCRRRSGALSGGWDARIVVGGAAVGGFAVECGVVEDEGTGEADEEESSGEGEEACCGSFVLVPSTRVGDFAVLAAGTTLGGFEELKNLPPGGFENRE